MAWVLLGPRHLPWWLLDLAMLWLAPALLSFCQASHRASSPPLPCLPIPTSPCSVFPSGCPPPPLWSAAGRELQVSQGFSFHQALLQTANVPEMARKFHLPCPPLRVLGIVPESRKKNKTAQEEAQIGGETDLGFPGLCYEQRPQISGETVLNGPIQ